MSTSPTLVGKLLPYLSYFLYAQLALLCAAILVGIGIFLSRILKKQPFEDDPAYTKERIAMEIHAEIARLRDLRNRIFPGFANDAEAVPVVAAAPAAPGMTAEEKAALEKEIEKKYKEELDYLRAKVDEFTKNPPAAAAPADGAAPAAPTQEMADVVAAAAREKAQLEEDTKMLKSKVEILEKTLSEYQIFENDIALVKKYKTENEELRKQLSASPQVTEDDIASLFSAMSVPGEAPGASGAANPMPQAPPSAEAAPAAPAPKKIFEPAPSEEAAPEQPAPPPEEIAQADATIDDLLREAEANASANRAAEPQAPPPAAAPAEAAPSPAPASAPLEPSATTALAASMTPDDLEALAETDQGGDDKLLAEFQKILGDKS